MTGWPPAPTAVATRCRAASPRRSRSAPIRLRRRARRFPSSSCCRATATVAEAARRGRAEAGPRRRLKVRLAADLAQAPVELGVLRADQVLAASHRRLVLADRGGERREPLLGEVALADRIEVAGSFDHPNRGHRAPPRLRIRPLASRSVAPG